MSGGIERNGSGLISNRVLLVIEGCKNGDCLVNVQRKKREVGGEIRFGWAVWQWLDVFVEAELSTAFQVSPRIQAYRRHVHGAF